MHADICGPMRTPSLNKNLYFSIFVDDLTRMTWVYFLKKKSEGYTIFDHFKALVEKHSGFYLKTLRTDRGGKFSFDKFMLLCKSLDIHRQLTTGYSPQ